MSLDHSNQNNKTYYIPTVRYQYTVDGNSYTGRRISAVEINGTDEAKARNTISEYKEGSKIIVFYNPSNPRDSVLSIDPSLELFILPLLGFIFVFASVFQITQKKE